MKVKQEVIAKKLEFVLSKPIEVDNQPSELVVKGVLDMQKATYKISTHITTKQVDPSNDQVTEGVLTTLGMMLAKMTTKMIEERHKLLQGASGGKNQMQLDFAPPAIKDEPKGEPAEAS